MNKIAFIGAGNMASAMIIGLINQGVDPNTIMVSNPSAPKREALAARYGIHQTASNIEAAQFGDLIILAVKPHFIVDVTRDIAQQLDLSEKCLISVAAGTTMQQITDAAGEKIAVIRAMPNTPTQVGLGVTGLFANQWVTATQKVATEQLIKSTGLAIWLKSESEIDHIIAVSGSGPAYFFLFMEAMEKKAIALGFSAEQARALVQQTALGAAEMVVKNPIPISQLRANVTSKGGTTNAAITRFEQLGLSEMVSEAMDAAIRRAKEMANEAK
jgi:pyrroline-5-carboxylate reductase